MARPCLFKIGDRDPTERGVFHRWGDNYVYGEGDERIPMTIAIVEEWASGKVYEIDPHNVTFEPVPEDGDESEEAQTTRDRLAEVER